jgi:pimeloyl-ACP methyl ester carboxylesterase
MFAVFALRRRYFLFVVPLTAFVLAMFASVNLNADWGRLGVGTVSVQYGGLNLSGLLYVPNSASVSSKMPGIVLAHGIGSAKQSMRGIALELVRRGFAALSLDLVGHGNSEGDSKTAVTTRA